VTTNFDFDVYTKLAMMHRHYTENYAIVFPALYLSKEVDKLIAKVLEVTKRTKQASEVDTEILVDQLGDILWYLAAVARDLGVPLSEVATRNLRKIEEN
jgi:NTP pyrophosphatase (non-canonical NTP hydrolase)